MLLVIYSIINCSSDATTFQKFIVKNFYFKGNVFLQQQTTEQDK